MRDSKQKSLVSNLFNRGEAQALRGNPGSCPPPENGPRLRRGDRLSMLGLSVSLEISSSRLVMAGPIKDKNLGLFD